jgi:hypothetical protein
MTKEQKEAYLRGDEGKRPAYHDLLDQTDGRDDVDRLERRTENNPYHVTCYPLRLGCKSTDIWIWKMRERKCLHCHGGSEQRGML